MYRFETSPFIPIALSVSLTASGSTVAGEMYNLTCTIIELENINGGAQVLVLEWVGPNGDTITTESNDVSPGSTTTTGDTTVSTLTFDPLKISQVGLYACRAVITSLNQERTVSFNVTVQSE